MACTVTIVIPALNSATTLPHAIRSLLNQELQDFQLLIVDDGSTDDTEEVARSFATDPRIEVLPFPVNRGKSQAMNTAIQRAQGRWIAVLDADDWYSPQRLSRLISAGERHCVQLVADNQFIYDEGADQVVATAFDEESGDRHLDKIAFAAGCDPYADFDLGMLKPVVRTSFVTQVGLAYRETARLSEDFLYLVDFFSAGGVGLLASQPHYFWRQPFGRISRRWTHTGSGEWRYDFLAGAKAMRHALADLRDRDDRILLDLVTNRLRAFERLHRLQTLNRMRSDGATMARVALGVAGEPSIWSLVLRRMANRAVLRKRWS